MAAGPYGCRSCGVSALACEFAETDGPGCNGWVRAGSETVLHKIQLPPAPRNLVMFAQQGETDAPGTTRPANCTCSSFVMCTPCKKRSIDDAHREVMTAMERGCERETAQIYGDGTKVVVKDGMASTFYPQPTVMKPVDPLDVEYDGLTLRFLISCDEYDRHEVELLGRRFTPVQRAAVSAHWSAQLRAKVAAAKQAERNVVTYCEEDDP